MRLRLLLKDASRSPPKQNAFAANVLSVVRSIQAAGITGKAAIATALNDRVRTAAAGAGTSRP